MIAVVLCIAIFLAVRGSRIAGVLPSTRAEQPAQVTGLPPPETQVQPVKGEPPDNQSANVASKLDFEPIGNPTPGKEIPNHQSPGNCVPSPNRMFHACTNLDFNVAIYDDKRRLHCHKFSRYKVRRTVFVQYEGDRILRIFGFMGEDEEWLIPKKKAWLC